MTVTIAVGVLGSQLIGTPFGVFAAAQALSAFVVPALVALAVAATVTGRAPLGFVSALVGCGYLALIAPVVLAGSGPAPSADAPRITLVAANVMFRNDRISEVGDELAALDADVLALSEITPAIAEQLRAHPVADRYPYRVEAPAEFASGLMIWSRLPLGPVGEQAAFDRSIDTTVITDQGLVRVMLVHPPPPTQRRDVWNEELRSIAAVVDQTLFATVVVGDFNSSYFHPPFRRMIADADLHDALVDSGLGLTPTWPTDLFIPPFATLDHVLLDRSLATVGAGVSPIPGSDHRAVSATITFADEG